MSDVSLGARMQRTSVGVLDDARQSLRVIMNGPFISGAIVLLLALGIGLNVTVFSFLEATVTNPFPFPDAEKIVDVVRGSHQRGEGPFNHAALTALRDSSDIFAGVAGYRGGGDNVVVDGEGYSVWGAEVTANVFEVLGVQPVLGRTFGAGEEGRGGPPVVIISHHRWQEWFGGDAEVLGRTIEVNGVERTIVGVMPRGFRFYEANAVWTPLPVDATAPSNDTYRFAVVGRLRPEVSTAQAHAAITTLDETLRPLVPPRDELEEQRLAFGLRPAPLEEGLMIPGRVVIGIFLQLAAGIVMVVLGGNLAGLMFARGIARRREFAVRRALGASRSRLVRQIVVEHLLLALAGGGAGLVAAVWGHEVFIAVVPIMTGAGMRLDLRVLSFAVSVSTLAVLLFGSMPLLELSRAPAESVLKQWASGATAPRGARGWQNRLAILQIALSFLLLVGASLVLRSVVAIGTAEPGFDAQGMFEVHLSGTAPARSQEALRDATRRVAEALEAAPGITSVAWRNEAAPEVVGTIPELLSGSIETREGPSALAARFTFRRGPAVSAGFFDAFGLSLLRGRLFDDQDTRGAPLVAVLSERAADLLWPGQEAVGREIRWSGGRSWVTVIGVVSNMTRVARDQGRSSGMGVAPSPDIYLAAAQFDGRPSNNVLWVRPDTQAREAFPQLVRNVVSRVGASLDAHLVRTVWESEYGRYLDEYGAAGRVLGSLGGFVLLLAALGTYSVIAYTWAQRQREVGLRVACGAAPRDILRLVHRDCRKLAVSGVILGAIVALATYRFAASMFFEVAPWDPLSYLGVAMLLIGMASLAGLGPAVRALRRDPVAALRQQ